MNAPLNFHDMARRDPAIAVLMGAIAGADFGGYAAPSALEPSFEYGAQFGDDYGYGYGAQDPDAEYGYGYGLDQFGAARKPAHARHPAARRPPPHLAHTTTEARTLALDPNRNSTVKVERYSFSWSPASNLTLGTTVSLGTFTQQPSASIKGQRLAMNAPVYGFVTVDTLQIANVNVFVGGTEDAATYNNLAQGVFLDLPRLDPQNRATASGTYTGVLPPGYTVGAAFKFIVSLQGPAVLAGGYGQ